MTHRSLTILNHDIVPGTSVQLSMDIAKLPTRTRVEVPVFINRAKQEGPTVLLLAGMHGDELNGVEIVRRIICQDDHVPQSGTIICVPVANTFGFINQSRTVPDGRDLNRTFPGSAQGSLASRLAYTLLNEIVKPVDYILDFHTGGASRSNHPQVRVALTDEKSLELAQVFNAPFILASSYLDKSLRKAARTYDKTMLLYEGGESLRLDEQAVQAGLEGALRVLHHLDMRAEGVPTEAPLFCTAAQIYVGTGQNFGHVQRQRTQRYSRIQRKHFRNYCRSLRRV